MWVNDHYVKTSEMVALVTGDLDEDIVDFYLGEVAGEESC